MKKIANTILLYAALPLAIVASVFKMMHWPGANILLIAGLTFVALSSLLKYFAEKTLEGYVLGIAIALACEGVLFKLMHWPFSDWMIRFALAGAIFWILLSFRKKGDEEKD